MLKHGTDQKQIVFGDYYRPAGEIAVRLAHKLITAWEDRVCPKCRQEQRQISILKNVEITSREWQSDSPPGEVYCRVAACSNPKCNEVRMHHLETTLQCDDCGEGRFVGVVLKETSASDAIFAICGKEGCGHIHKISTKEGSPCNRLRTETIGTIHRSGTSYLATSPRSLKSKKGLILRVLGKTRFPCVIVLVDRRPSSLYREELKKGFSRTVFSGTRKAYSEALEKEEQDRLAIVLWALMGWMEWIQFLGTHKQEACGSLALEAQVDLEASVYLALSGFVKQALQVLRSWLELSLLGIWFSYSKKEYEIWMYRLHGAPFVSRGSLTKKWLLALVNKSSELKDCETKYGLVDRLLKSYAELSASTHTRGYPAFETIGRRHHIATYNPKNFDKWYKHFWTAYSLVSAILFLRFPDSYLRDRQEWDHIANGMMGSHLEMVKKILT